MNKLILTLTLLIGALGGVNAQSFDFSCIDATIRYEYIEGTSLSFDGFDLDRAEFNADQFTVPSAYYSNLTYIDGITINRNSATNNWEITIYDDGRSGDNPPHDTLLEAINYLRYMTGREQLGKWDVNSPLILIYNDEIKTGRFDSNGVIWNIESRLWLLLLNSQASPTVWEVRRLAQNPVGPLTLEEAIDNLAFGPIYIN